MTYDLKVDASGDGGGRFSQGQQGRREGGGGTSGSSVSSVSSAPSAAHDRLGLLFTQLIMADSPAKATDEVVWSEVCAV